MDRPINNSSVQGKAIYRPMINGLQKMALYTTSSRCYLIGSNNTQTKFRLLKIDRTDPHELILTDDQVEYTQSEIKELLQMIGGGNKISNKNLKSSSVPRTVSAFGIFGFIRFLEGYYIILITKRRKIAVIGHHSIYKVEDTSMIYLPHESIRTSHEDEYKYCKLFNNIDLTSNFYFSYSYDLSNSLQFNMSSICNFDLDEDAKKIFVNSATADGIKDPHNNTGKRYGFRTFSSERFVWNRYLLEPIIKTVHPTWIIPITQGFLAQSSISIIGRPFYVTLIARRSASYAGTRFLKRGVNFEGDVANEVETEQIVHDSHISSLHLGRFASFVQIRGSIPCHWSQDISKMVPKPPIIMDVWDPYAEAGGKHFNKLLRRFGSPIIVLNLVKRREKKRHESILNEEYIRLIQQLNHTIHPTYRIQHISVDMARINKDKKENVMNRLADIAYQSIKKTGIFLSRPPYYMQHLNPNLHYQQLERISSQGDRNFGIKGSQVCGNRGRLQTGIVRVNCVDCLDRTNTAQFSLGKCALGFQLYCLGVLEKPNLEFDCDCVQMLEEMYEDHGDTLALQYGGSQLVHRIATYRKTAPWTSQGNDIRQSLTRYVSNTFSDQEKQQAINLFLGVFIPLKYPCPIWELTSDYILHQSLARNKWPCHRKSTAQWWDSEIMEWLPLPCDLVKHRIASCIELKPDDPTIDLFNDYHRPFEMSPMSEFFPYVMNQCSRYSDSSQSNDFDPFSVRTRHGSRRPSDQPPSNKISLRAAIVDRKNSLVGGSASPSSNASSGASSTETEATEDEKASLNEIETESERFMNKTGEALLLQFPVFFPPYEESYGTIIHPISEEDMGHYKRCSDVGNLISKPPVNNMFLEEEGPISFAPLCHTFKCDIYEIPEPEVSEEAILIYQNYVMSGEKGPAPPRHDDLLKYQMYISGA